MTIGKRVTVATIAGLLFGFVCFGLASSGPNPLPWAIALQLILSRTLMGFAIGISRVHMGHWTVHGLVMGLIFSLPLSVGSFMMSGGDFSSTTVFIMTNLMGAIYGLLTELITTVLFKAPMEKAAPTPVAV